MSASIRPIPRAPLDRASADRLYNDFVEGFEELREEYRGQFVAYLAENRGAAIPEIFFAKVKLQGPNGETDFTDARYYLFRAKTDKTLDYDKYGTGKDLFGVEDADIFGPGAARDLIGTNLAELPKSGTQFRHSIKLDTPVLVTAIRDQANPQKKYYVFFCQPPAGTFKVNLTQDNLGSSPPTYTVKDLLNNTLGTSMTPEATIGFTNLVAADTGLGYYDDSGVFFLLYAFEAINTELCPTAP